MEGSEETAVITAVPEPTAVTFPALSTVTTFVFELCHDTDLSVAFAGSTVAVSVEVLPMEVNDNAGIFKVMLVTGITSFKTK